MSWVRHILDRLRGRARAETKTAPPASAEKAKQTDQHEAPEERKVWPRYGQPYYILTDLIDAFGALPGRQLLLLGDSVMGRTARQDPQRIPLSTMLTERLGELGLPAHVSFCTAYSPRIHEHILRALQRLPNHPDTVVIGMNPRCFSPQWLGHPVFAYDKEKSAIEAWLGGAAEIPVIDDPALADLDYGPYEQLPVILPDGSMTKVGDIRAMIAKKNKDAVFVRERLKYLFLYHYAQPITADHPELAALDRMLATIKSIGARALVYVTPVNVELAAELAGPTVEQHLREVAEKIDEVCSRARKDGLVVDFRDWHGLLGTAGFLRKEETTEHLCQQGRETLRDQLVGAVLQFRADSR